MKPGLPYGGTGFFVQGRTKMPHTGKIKKIVQERGFGFISDTDGREIFFHQSGLIEAKFDTLKEEQKVEFEIENSPKGPRAISITVVKE
jgi:cold shock protein